MREDGGKAEWGGTIKRGRLGRVVVVLYAHTNRSCKCRAGQCSARVEWVCRLSLRVEDWRKRGGTVQARNGNPNADKARRERECHELGCRAAAAAQITNRLSLQDVDELMLRRYEDTVRPFESVRTSLHAVDRHTSSQVRLLCITPLLVRERQLRHPEAFDINQIAITAPDPAEPACICNMQLRYAVSLICRQRASWLSRPPILDGTTDSCPKHPQPFHFPVSVTSIKIAYRTGHYDSGCSLSQ